MTRAIIEGMVDDFHYRVRIPLLNKIAAAIGSTPIEELAIATLAVAPGISPKFRNGNIVFVEFEEGDTSKPVIVGSLFNTLESSVVSDAQFDSLIVNVNTELPRDTSIGDVTDDNIAFLEGLSTNVQYEIDKNKKEHDEFRNQINQINQKIDEIEENIDEIEENIDKIEQDIENINNEIDQIHETDLRQDREITSVENRVTNIEGILDGPLILNKISYGTADPNTITNAVEGQVYLWIQTE